jgi:phenylpropionate dioxygenase-like ring-hydroxylating dioxygenase large terminal subunit
MDSSGFQQYYSDNVFQLEHDKVFSRLWVFACSIVDLPKSNSYFLVKMPFGEIIVSRDGDKLSAFHNKCLHRGHPLVSLQRGESAFVCPYHNWCYNSTGGLINIPGDIKHYQANKEEYTFERLQPVSIKRLGDFIFINNASSPIGIESQFDREIIANLERTKNKLGPVSLSLSINLNFNWKLIFENLRDYLHPLYLHATSLIQEVDFYASQSQTSSTESLPPIEHAIQISSFSRDGDLKNANANYKNDFVLCDNGENYLNWLLFPFTHVACPDGGVLYGVENYVPVSAEQTRLDLSLYVTKNVGKTSPIPILYDWLMKAQVVLGEDFTAVTSVQRAAKHSDQTQHLGIYESQNVRINRFLEKYINE